jgi:hypothetical protein
MSEEEYKLEFKPWYNEQLKLTNWNFSNEMKKYCRADVELLSKTVLKFRSMFIENLDTDPFRYTTIASLCMNIYIHKFMPSKKIVGNNTNKKDSLVCREWLNYLNDDKIYREFPINILPPPPEYNIHKNKIINDGNKKKGEQLYKKYYDLKRPFVVDGLDIKNKQVYLFQGCYWHGCRKCHPENEIKYDKTMEQVNLLESAGYTVNQMWECDWIKLKSTLSNKDELEEHAKQQNIITRDALCGGRTEGFKTHVKCNENQQIFLFDVVSLYPSVNALDSYPVGFSKYCYKKITSEDILNDNFFGLAKVDIIPPKNLYIPVIPDNTKGKLLFHLNNMYNKTLTSVELKLALQKGYKITKIHSA